MISFKKIAAFLAVCLLVLYLVPLIVEGLKPTTEHMRADMADIKTLQLDNHTMAYQTYGNGPDLILIHGFSHSSICWEKNIQPLVDAGYRVHTVDLFGHGMSDKPYGIRYSLELYAGQIHEFMKAIEIERAHLIGHSMGGAVALKTACMYPSAVKGLILIGSAGLLHERKGNFVFSLMRYPLLGEFLILFYSKPAVRLINSSINTNGLMPIDDDYIDRFVMPSRTRGYSFAFLRILRNFGNRLWAVEDCIAGIKAPASILHGTEDRLIPVESGKQMHTLLAASRLLIVPGGPHALMETHSSLVNGKMVEFLRSGR